MHTHGAGGFGYGLSSTSHMEYTWSHLINEIKSIYNFISSSHFILYLIEAEFRLRLSQKKDSSEKLYILNKLVYETNTFDFFTEEELLDMDNYDY